MKSESYAQKKYRFLRNLGRTGFVFISIGLFLGLLGVDMYRQNEIAYGRVVEDVRSGHYSSTQLGDKYVDTSHQKVEFAANGKIWTMNIVGTSVGNTILLRYYKRWPGIAWVGSGITWTFWFGVFMSVLGASFLLASRVGDARR